MLPVAFIHSVHLRHLFSSCWSLANQVQSICISINDFKTFYSHTHTSVLDMTGRIFMHGITILCRIEYELLVSSLFFIFFTCTWSDIQKWQTVLWVRREHHRTSIMVPGWHFPLPFTVRLIPKEAGLAPNTSHPDFCPQGGIQCLG